MFPSFCPIGPLSFNISFLQYDQYKTPMENIGLQDSLLSRFDCIFIMLDKNDVDNDTVISDHIVNIHRYRTPGEADGERKNQLNYCELNFN